MSLQVWYYSTPDSVPNNNDLPNVAVVVDVLRATTTITKLLEQGADAVETFEDVVTLKQAASQYKGDNKLLVGERGGVMVKGFDLGNSPAAIQKDVVKDKRVFMSTTNGTRALAKVREVEHVFCAALSNRTAVAKRVLRLMGRIQVKPNETRDVWIIGSGGEGKFSLEDTLCAGSIARALEQADVHTVPTVVDLKVQYANDDMLAALAVWECYKDNTEACLRKASHGKVLANLMSQADVDADFEACSTVDTSEAVPKQTRPGELRIA